MSSAKVQRAAGALEASSSTSASLFPRIMRRKRRAETDDDSCNDHANGQVSDRKISRVDAVSSTMDETESVSISHFSDDVLLRIFRFFVYSLGTIDGISLKSSMLVCRRWNKAVSYPALWKIPAGLSLRCSSDTNDNDSSSGNPRTISRSTIQSSLQIQDISCGKDLSDSLLGFVNLGKNSESKEFITYNARERATNRHCTLKISKTTTRNKEMLREIFWTHFLQGDNNRFYALDHPRNTKKRRPEFNLAKGVHMVSGRVICGYQDRQPALKQYISLSLKEPCPSLLGCFLYQNERQRWDPKDIMSCLRNLEGHPLASLPENLQQKTITPFRRDRWAKLVDWVVEIVECFDLEDNLAFRAFMYLDHFASTSNIKLGKEKYQLYAGTALMLAAKCESSVLPEITCTDVVFSADNTFGSQDMEAAEENLLSCLQWKLAIPTIFDFVELYSEILGIQNDQSLSSRRILCMMRYLSELVVQTTIHSSFLPSMVSSCIVVLSLFRLKDEANALGANLWPDQMVEITGYSWKSLEGCFNTMSPLLNDIFNTMPDLTIISRRYQKAIRENVASVHIPIITSFTELTTYREEQRRQLCLSASATSTDSTG